jgi:hypothetical protein
MRDWETECRNSFFIVYMPLLDKKIVLSGVHHAGDRPCAVSVLARVRQRLLSAELNRAATIHNDHCCS